MENNRYCPAGKIECECLKITSNPIGALPKPTIQFEWCELLGFGLLVDDMEQCPWPSKQKPIAPNLSHDPDGDMLEFNAGFAKGFAAAKTQAVDAVKDLKPIKSWTSDGEKFTDYWIPIHKDTQLDAIAAISAIEVRHD